MLEVPAGFSSVHRDWTPVGWLALVVALLLLSIALHSNTGLTAVVMVLTRAVAVGTIFSMARSIVVEQDSIIFRRFYFGERQLRIGPGDLTSIRFYYIRQRGWGSPVFSLLVFEVGTTFDRNRRDLHLLGWNSRRSLLGRLAAMARDAGLTLHARTEGVLKAVTT